MSHCETTDTHKHKHRGVNDLAPSKFLN